MLECNRLRGRQSYNPFNEKTDEYKNRWVNNVSSYGITINKGDIISCESVAVNTSGTIQDTIEILADENEDGVMDNTIGLEFLYYINNSGYSGLPLPLLNMTTYIGYDNPRSMGNGLSGASIALPVFVDFMQNGYKDEPSVDFIVPDSIELQMVDYATGQPSTEKGAILEALKSPNYRPAFDAPSENNSKSYLF